MFNWYNPVLIIRFEKLQAAKFADNLKLEHGFSDIETVTIDDGEEDINSEDGQLLNMLLPLNAKNQIHRESVAPDMDSKTARRQNSEYTYKSEALIFYNSKSGARNNTSFRKANLMALDVTVNPIL